MAARRCPGNNGDVRFAIEQFARSIASADAKGGLLAAALAILAGAVGQQAQTLVRDLPPRSVADWASAAGIAVAVGALVVSATFTARAIAPAIASNEGFSRYSWSVIEAPIADLVAGDHRQDREHAWRMAVVLASIARRKFQRLRRAFTWWACAAIAFLVAALGGLLR